MNQKGFLVVALIVLMPLIMSALALIGGAFLLFKGDSATRHGCRAELLLAQTRAAEDLERLLAMNAQARALRIKRVSAEASVRLAPDPATRAAALAHLKIVIAEQARFAARQNALILHARMISRRAPQAAREKVSRAARAASPSRDPTPLVRSRSGAFPLIARPPGSPTPDYQAAPNFSEAQTAGLRWSYSSASFLPDWFARQLNLSRLHTAAECAATIEKENQKWQPKLVETPKARFWSNFW